MIYTVMYIIVLVSIDRHRYDEYIIGLVNDIHRYVYHRFS